MRLIEFEQSSGKRHPKWMRTLVISDDGDEVFVPAAIAGNEDNVYLCTLFDGTATVSAHNHLYVPADWLAKEFPKAKELCEIMKASAKASLGNAS